MAHVRVGSSDSVVLDIVLKRSDICMSHKLLFHLERSHRVFKMPKLYHIF